MEIYKEFLEIVKKIHVIEYISHALSWDKEVVMTKGGAKTRAKQVGVLAGLAHELMTSQRLGELLSELEQVELNPDEACNVREMRREYDQAIRVPNKLVQKLATTTSQAHDSWVAAREAKDFSLFSVELKKIVELKREYARLVNPEGDLYENLLHDYEPWFTPTEIDTLFLEIKEALVPLIKKIHDEQNTVFLKEDVDHKVQLAYNKHIAEVVGFDMKNGRLDLAVHPFTSHPADVRITTRFTDGWWKAISSTLHEAGHGMYEQNLPKEHTYTPRGMDAWMAVHESQSRLWENQVGLADWFWKKHFADLKEKYSLSCSFEEFHKAINQVRAGFIRVNADELTYPLHIILRYEIERDLINGKLEVEDLPRMWNEKMQEYLGITPPDDALGVLQDVHWSSGYFGYFPTYLLGNVLSAQYFAAANTTNVTELNEWLQKNIHEKGRLYSTHELTRQATGNEPRADEYLEYLRKKYTDLYGL